MPMTLSQSVGKRDYTAVRKAIEDILDVENYDDGSYGPLLVGGDGSYGPLSLGGDVEEKA